MAAKAREQAALGRVISCLAQMEAMAFITAVRTSARRRPVARSWHLARHPQRGAGYFLEQVRRATESNASAKWPMTAQHVYAAGCGCALRSIPEIKLASRECLARRAVALSRRAGWRADCPHHVERRQLGEPAAKARARGSIYATGAWALSPVAAVRQRDRLSDGFFFLALAKLTLTGPARPAQGGRWVASEPHRAMSGGAHHSPKRRRAGGCRMPQLWPGFLPCRVAGVYCPVPVSTARPRPNASRFCTILLFFFFMPPDLDNGMTLSTQIDNSRYLLLSGCEPRTRNASAAGSPGRVPMRYGFEQSQNIMTVQIGMTAGMGKRS